MICTRCYLREVKNKMAELISVIVPIYNVEKYLSKCIDSILEQSYRNLEIILVDDGSTDASGRICDVYLGKDQRIQVIHKANGGLSDARNAGIDVANGEYFAFVDADDFISSSMFERLLYIIKEEKADVALCGFQSLDETGKCIPRMTSTVLENGCYDRDYIFRKSFGIDGWNFIVAWNKLYPRRLFDSIRFYKGKLHEDEFIFHHIISQCQKIAVIEEKLYYYLQRCNSITMKAYNISRLDATEAILLRCRYFIENKRYHFFVETEKLAFEGLLKGLRFLDYGSSKWRFMEIQKAYRRLILYIVVSSHFSLSKKIKLVLFCIKPVFLKFIVNL